MEGRIPASAVITQASASTAALAPNTRAARPLAGCLHCRTLAQAAAGALGTGRRHAVRYVSCAVAHVGSLDAAGSARQGAAAREQVKGASWLVGVELSRQEQTAGERRSVGKLLQRTLHSLSPACPPVCLPLACASFLLWLSQARRLAAGEDGGAEEDLSGDVFLHPR